MSLTKQLARNVKQAAKLVLSRTLDRPLYLRYGSQTVYESCLGCLRMFDATGDRIWLERAERTVAILLEIQCPDGGFDNGYPFNFGYQHNKGEAISPELPGLLAMAMYARTTGEIESLQFACSSAAEWVRRWAFEVRPGEWGIPYGPHSCTDVVNYNGVSFACGALASYISVFGGAEQDYRIYNGFIMYMDRTMTKSTDARGRYWYYADQEDPNLSVVQRNKIDYYHQMQQVEMHAIAQQIMPNDTQLQLIRDAADHIVDVYTQNGIVPYTPCRNYFGGNIHTWGFCSVASGLLEAAIVLPDLAEAYRNVAIGVGEWLLKYSWRGKSFIPILTVDGAIVDSNSYARTDAWCFNTFALLSRELGEARWQKVAEEAYLDLERRSFSGPENHYLPAVRKYFYGAWSRILALQDRGSSGK